MSLKAFHIFFITLSTLLAIGCGVWTSRLYIYGHNAVDLGFAIASFATAIALVIYGVWFLRKTKRIIV